MNVLVLDDSLERLRVFRQNLIGHSVTTVETSKDAISKLSQHDFDTVFLDHDLGGKAFVKSGDGTGFEVAEWLSKHPEKKPKQIIIHSFNPTGAQNMKNVLPEAQLAPGCWTSLK
jgi:CheY-like chemotaxis protein